MQISLTCNSSPDISIGRSFFALLKPRVMSLVIFTGFVGMMIAPYHGNALLGFMIILAIGLSAGGAGCLNMWYERDIDALMKRTQKRPIPSGQVDADSALAFGVIVSLFSFAIMGLASNWLAASYLIFANLFYVLVYTMMLKRTTAQNIVIGGAAGALPPVIGWVALSGENAIVPWMLFLIIFLWTPPHFWALSITTSDDYKKAGVPMMPNVKGIESTKTQILIYSILMSMVVIGLAFMPQIGKIYSFVAVIGSGIFIAIALACKLSAEHKYSKKLFFYSIFYLFALFLALLLDKVVSNG